MGQFPAGRWFVGLLLYFFIFFIIVNYVGTAAAEYGIDGVEFDDPGFSDLVNTSVNTSAAAADTGSWSSFWDTISFMTGIGAEDVEIGLPGAYQYIFSFLFFWIELVMLIWAGWMALPFFH